MTDLVILVPSRGRPASVARLIEACAKTCRTSVVLHFGFDEDDADPNIAAIPSSVIFDPVRFDVQPRMGLVAWTNHLASLYANRPPAYLASMGDDMLPITDGWDERLITAIEHMGGGIAYPNDRRRADIPEMFVVSSRIVQALGWMMLPALEHWYPDNVWSDIGHAAGCITYCDDVIVEHLHPNVRPDVTKPDGTYHDAATHLDTDRAAYQRWRLRGLPADVQAVQCVRADSRAGGERPPGIPVPLRAGPGA